MKLQLFISLLRVLCGVDGAKTVYYEIICSCWNELRQCITSFNSAEESIDGGYHPDPEWFKRMLVTYVLYVSC